MKIHKAGYKVILVILFILTVLNLIVITGLYDMKLLWILFLTASLIFFSLVLYFFRNPAREVEEDQSKIMVPADGKVVAIEEVVENEYFMDKRLQVSVFMSVFNVHCNRYPVSGIVRYAKHKPGKYYIASHPKSSEYNERSSTVIMTDDGNEIMVRQIAGAVARRIISSAELGERVRQGDELGFIRFGSRVDIFMPLGTKPRVKMNQEVKANIDILAIKE